MKDIPNVPQKDILAADKARQRVLDTHTENVAMCELAQLEIAGLLAKHGEYCPQNRSFVLRQASYMSDFKLAKFMQLVLDIQKN